MSRPSTSEARARVPGDVHIRAARHADAEQWCRMRTELWPDDHEAEVARYFAGSRRVAEVVLVADLGEGTLGGFIELSLRSYAEDCRSSPVPYIEGWYVAAELRRSGLGRALVEAGERWAVAAGFDEIASDCALDNDASRAAHQRLGYAETYRIICFRKELNRT